MDLSIAAPVELEIDKIRGSRFIGFALPHQGRAGIAEIVEGRRQLHPKACHHCWAYRGCSEPDQGSSDDGEPRGSAGVPMAKVLAGRGFVATLVIVTRYFGGTKLGVGGLVRAYGEATRAVLAACEPVPFERRVTACIELPFDESALVYRIVARHGIDPRTSTLDDGAGLRLTLELTVETWATIVDDLEDLRSPNLRWKTLSGPD